MGRISEEAKEMFQKKQANIKSISEEKSLGMEYANSLNNAVKVWSVLAEYPEIKPSDALEDIGDLVDFFRSMKGNIKEEMTAEKAVQETEKVFPGSQAEPGHGTYQPPPPVDEPCTDPQRKMIFVQLSKKGYDKNKHVEIAQKFLNLQTLKSITDLTKRQARYLIDLLMKMEKPPEDDNVPFEGG